MKPVRLLPVVICAALALLLFKGIGLITNGGYVLTGTAVARAEEHGETSGEATNDAIMELPPEPTMTDSSPTIDDGAPTLPLRPSGKGGGEGSEEGEAASEGDAGGAEDEGEERATRAEETACPAAAEQAAEATGGENPAEGFDFSLDQDGCPVDPGVNAAGDSLPVIMDGAGNIVPMDDDAPGSEQAVLERLGARREALDAREAELDMQMALVEAAEKRIAERTAALEALEARIKALVEGKKTADESQFASIVTMYETMKPKEAAAIFDQLEMPILLRVASAMSPRKMAPIMAKMEPQKAKDLTANMAVEQAQAAVEIGPEDLGALPQIVGQ